MDLKNARVKKEAWLGGGPLLGAKMEGRKWVGRGLAHLQCLPWSWTGGGRILKRKRHFLKLLSKQKG
jgi:hypothetical protein